MRTNLNLFLCFLCLAFISLACLTTVDPYVTYPADTPRAGQAPTVISTDAARASAPSTLTPSPSPGGRGEPECAVISADEALHLRVGPDEHSRSLAFMESGEVVQVIRTTNADWWLIRRDGEVGYARSKYLEKSEC